MKSAASFLRALTVFGLFAFAGVAQAEVLLQWFETDWDEMYQKLPKAVEAGYDLLRGKPLPSTTVLIPGVLLTRETVPETNGWEQ